MMIVFIYGETNISKVSQPPAGPRSFCWMVGWLDGWCVGCWKKVWKNVETECGNVQNEDD